jgi:hypothetical protein
MKTRLFGFAAAGLLLVALDVSGCHPNPGDECTDSPGSCADKASHYVCTNKKIVLETCKGPGGCNDDKSLICDNSKADVGDGCGHEGARACSIDGTKELRCRDAQFQVEWSCKGGCTTDAEQQSEVRPDRERRRCLPARFDRLRQREQGGARLH